MNTWTPVKKRVRYQTYDRIQGQVFGRFEEPYMTQAWRGIWIPTCRVMGQIRNWPVWHRIDEAVE